MCDKYGIDDKTRFLVLYVDGHLSGQEIATIINRSAKLIYQWERRTKKGEDIRIHKGGNGRKKSITEETEHRVVQMAKENPEAASLSKLRARIGDISANSIWRILTKHGFRYKGADKGIYYTQEERFNRIDFCKKMLADDGKLIYQTFYSDEMAIQLSKVHKTKIWQLPTDKFKKKCSSDCVKLNCWGAISAQGATSLDIYETGLNGDLYQQVIKRHKAEMEKLYPDGEFFFIQDNHAAHKKSEDWIIADQRLGLIKFPKRSPDLNIIENLWSAMKGRVASDAPMNEKELRASLLNHWELLTEKDRMQPLFEGLHRRYMLCLEKGGDKFKY